MLGRRARNLTPSHHDQGRTGVLPFPSYTRDGQGVGAMRYGIQTAANEQTSLFAVEQTAKPKQASVSIYRVTLVREGKMPTYESRIRSSANAYTVLQDYLADTDREH